ncbi:unannotated protein [freshwater metagenome]|uniref:Unannotated protein n=1 Tax=freshwater metagenome TaxID=449393 RepID=A0A6J7GDR0_9ZZZZ
MAVSALGRDRLVHRDQLRSVGKRRFHHHLGKQFGHTTQYVVGREHFPARRHQLGHGLSVTSTLEEVIGDDRDRLGVIEFQAASTAPPREFGGVADEQSILLVRRQPHVGSPSDR